KIHALGTGSDTISFTPADAASYDTAPAGSELPPISPPSAAPTTPLTNTRGSSFPAVTPADLVTIRSHNLLIPVRGVTADKLVDSFDDLRGGTRHHEALDIMSPRG